MNEKYNILATLWEIVGTYKILTLMQRKIKDTERYGTKKRKILILSNQR